MDFFHEKAEDFIYRCTDAILYDMYVYITPCWELTYPLPAGTFKDDFPFPRVGYVRAYYFRLQI